MRRVRRLRPSPAMVVACTALFVAGAGTATAAKLITGKQIKNSSITSTDVRNGSLLRKDFKSAQLPRGPQGLPGASGRAGRDGFGVLSYRTGFFPLAAANAGSDDEDSRIVLCPAGQYPTGGDAYAVDPDDDNRIVSGVVNAEFFNLDGSGRPNSWAADATNTNHFNVEVFIEVICANAAQPPAPAATAKAKASAGRASTRIREARPVE